MYGWFVFTVSCRSGGQGGEEAGGPGETEEAERGESASFDPDDAAAPSFQHKTKSPPQTDTGYQLLFLVGLSLIRKRNNESFPSDKQPF